MNTSLTRAWAVLAIGWIGVFIAVAMFRPLMPVDETRYLSVAWEMWVQHHWTLPTLNFEPYSHKPPLLFWLINIAWHVFGVGIWPARIVTFAITVAFVVAAGRLSKRLMPQDHDIAVYAMLLLGAMPMFLIYGSVIMFDTMMGVCVICAMIMIWRIAHDDARPWTFWFMLGGIIGAGFLAKGPVALVYMLPPALLAPVWCPKPIGRAWYAGIGVAVLTGAAIALCWAIPAVMTGGAEYGDKIFVTQSAGRMINAFDHRRPAWFYVAVLAAYLLPLLVWPSVWTATRKVAREHIRHNAVRFVLCWIVPAFVFFSAISSKQFHYMTPILPGFAVLAALMLARGHFPRPESVAWPMGLMALPSVLVIGFEIAHKPFFGLTLAEASEHIGYAHIALSAALIAFARRKPSYALHALAGAAFLLAIMIHVQLGPRFLPRFDLSPLAAAAQEYRTRPMAAAPKYDGEYGFLFRTQTPIESIGREDIDAWFVAHPNGVMIARYERGAVPDKYDILFRQDFRTSEEILLLQRRPTSLAARSSSIF